MIFSSEIFVFFVSMALFFSSLNSGSNGNCYYIGNEKESILIDAGLSCKETEKRMSLLNLSMSSVKAIFISHEHIDHIKGVEVLAKKHGISVYITSETLKNSRTPIPSNQIIPLISYQSVEVGDLTITAFPKFHDAVDPNSFIIQYGNLKVGVFTDIGCVCEHVINHFKQCHVAFLEANYDDEMLENGNYPFHLKQRIKGDNGHLSNKQALDLFIQHRPEYMSHLLLSHLSKENNNPELVYKLFNENTINTEIIIASRYQPTPLYCLENSVQKKTAPKNLMQLNLFE